MDKHRLFRKALAGDFTYSDIAGDKAMLEQMAARDWMLVIESTDQGELLYMVSKYHRGVRSGGSEWQVDILDSLRDLGRI